MQDLVQKYGGTTGLKKIIASFYERVRQERGLMHYFFSVPLVQIVADQLTYATYIMRKPDMDYRQDIVQTAIADIRISMHAFEDVIKVLHIVLADAKVHRNDAPRMAMHIIEIIEETRSKVADTKKSFYKPEDISTDVLLTFFRSQGIESKLNAATDEIDSMAMYGLAYPLHTTIDKSGSAIQLYARAKAKESIEVSDVQTLVMAASTLITPLHFRGYKDEDGLAIFEGSYRVPTQYGVPKRLLQRVTNQFTWRFEEAFKADSQELLINVMAPSKDKVLFDD